MIFTTEQGEQVMDNSPNIPWLNGINLTQWGISEIGLPLIAWNDMGSAGEGENAQGVLLGVLMAIFHTISTGWGGITKVGDRIILGEPGHGRTYYPVLGKIERQCGCSRKGCLEANCSGGNVRKIIQTEVCPHLVDSQGLIEGLDPCAFLDKMYEAKANWAYNLYTDIALNVGTYWATLLNNLSEVQCIAYMGKFAMRGMKYMLPTIHKVMLDMLMYPQHRRLLEKEVELGEPHLIKPSSIWPAGALIGACIVYERLYKQHHA